MKIDGNCHCGEIAFSAEIDPDQVSICHCSDCQVLTGTAFRTTVPVARSRLSMTRGTPRTYVKNSESGRPRLQLFCGTCGTPLFTTGEGAAAEVVGIRWGAIHQRAALPPKRQKWCRSSADWLDSIAALPATAGE